MNALDILNAKRAGIRQKAAMLELIQQSGVENPVVMITSGTPHATAKCSNRMKTIAYLEKQGYQIIGEALGAKKRYKSEGCVIYFAVIKE